MTANGRLASSFRDPSGFLFVRLLFRIDQAVKIGGSERSLYLMRRKADRT